MKPLSKKQYEIIREWVSQYKDVEQTTLFEYQFNPKSKSLTATEIWENIQQRKKQNRIFQVFRIGEKASTILRAEKNKAKPSQTEFNYETINNDDLLYELNIMLAQIK